jgi:hypothetical protein
MKLRLLPGSLAARTALVLLIGLALVQAGGLTIHALDRMDIQRLAQMRDLAVRIMVTYRNVTLAPADQRDEVLREMNRAPGLVTSLGPATCRKPRRRYSGCCASACSWCRWRRRCGRTSSACRATRAGGRCWSGCGCRTATG